MANNYTTRPVLNNAYGQGINPDYAEPQTIILIIGRNGVAGCDFNFAAAADHVRQDLKIFENDANHEILSIAVKCIEAVTTVADVEVILGTATGTDNILAAISCDELNEIVNGIIPSLNWSQVHEIFLGADPTDQTWNDMDHGKWQITIVLKDYSKL